MSSSGGKRNYYNDDAAAGSGVAMPDPRMFGLAHATPVDGTGAVMPDPRVSGLAHATAADTRGVVMPYRGNFGPRHATIADGSGVVTRDPSSFEMEPATAPAFPEEGGIGHEEGDAGEPDGKKRFKNFPWYVTIWGWALLVIQGLVMGVLYLDGGGRVVEVKYPVDNSTTPAVILWDDGECSTAQGPPFLAEAVVLRAVTAVVTQLITFCASDLGLLKPFEAMWVVFGYVMHFLGLGMACCCGIMATLPSYEVTTTTTYNDGSSTRSTSTETPGWCACLFVVLVWIGIPATLIWNFTFRVAAFNLMAVCDLVLDGAAIYWFRMGSLVFMIMGIVVISCCNGSWKTGSIVPFARAFLVVDSLAIGATAVWGNYVQSGVVAGMFALLPLFNFFLTGLELGMK